jgi:hypothetical protein
VNPVRIRREIMHASLLGGAAETKCRKFFGSGPPGEEVVIIGVALSLLCSHMAFRESVCRHCRVWARDVMGHLDPSCFVLRVFELHQTAAGPDPPIRGALQSRPRVWRERPLRLFSVMRPDGSGRVVERIERRSEDRGDCPSKCK